MGKEKINKAVWIGAIIGSVYALVLAIMANLEDPSGTYGLYIISIFLPAWITYNVISILINYPFFMIGNIDLHDNLVVLLSVSILNALLWALIGGLIVKLFRKIKAKKDSKEKIKIKKINKAVWIGVIIGGVYALIPAILGYWEPFTTPLFLPVRITFKMTGAFIAFLGLVMDLFDNDLYLSLNLLLAETINVILWILIGGLVGGLFHRVKTKRDSKKYE